MRETEEGWAVRTRRKKEEGQERGMETRSVKAVASQATAKAIEGACTYYMTITHSSSFSNGQHGTSGLIPSDYSRSESDYSSSESDYSSSESDYS